MAQATTTIPTIVGNMVSVISGLTPPSLSDRAYLLYVMDGDFDEWCEANPSAALRRYVVREEWDYGAPTISNTDVELITTTLEVSMAYPRLFADYQTNSAQTPRGIMDLDNIMRDDMHQIRDAIGLNGAANYVSGQNLSSEESITLEEGEAVMFLRMPFTVMFYKAMG